MGQMVFAKNDLMFILEANEREVVVVSVIADGKALPPGSPVWNAATTQYEEEILHHCGHGSVSHEREGTIRVNLEIR